MGWFVENCTATIFEKSYDERAKGENWLRLVENLVERIFWWGWDGKWWIYTLLFQISWNCFHIDLIDANIMNAGAWYTYNFNNTACLFAIFRIRD